MLTALHAASLAFPASSHSSRPHRFPFHVGGKLSACLQEQLGLVCSAVTLWPRQSRLCPKCPEADGSALAGTQELQGVVGFEALGLQDAYPPGLLRFSHSLPEAVRVQAVCQ